MPMIHKRRAYIRVVASDDELREDIAMKIQQILGEKFELKRQGHLHNPANARRVYWILSTRLENETNPMG